MDSHADTIEKQKEKIRDLQTEREAAASAASTARDEVRETLSWGRSVLTHQADFTLRKAHLVSPGEDDVSAAANAAVDRP